jgi:hypothetical protein
MFLVGKSTPSARSVTLALGGLDRRYDDGYTSGMKTAISIPDEVFRSADSLAKRLGVSRSQLYATAITEFLLRHQSRKVTERLDHIYEEEDSSLAQGFIAAEMKSLPSEEW